MLGKAEELLSTTYFGIRKVVMDQIRKGVFLVNPRFARARMVVLCQADILGSVHKRRISIFDLNSRKLIDLALTL